MRRGAKGNDWFSIGAFAQSGLNFIKRGNELAISLDLRKAHKTFVKGDVLAVLTWVDGERALVLLPKLRAAGAPWFIVCESAAYLYDDARYLARQCAKAAEVLGMDETISTARRIADIILNVLPDLIRMPPSPPTEKLAPIGTVKLFADGVQVAEKEVTPDKLGAVYA